MSVGHFHASRNEDAARRLLSRAYGSRPFRDYIHNERFKVSRDFDIPYLAGYSLSGKVIYVDRHLPISLLVSGKRLNILPFLITHERVEKGLIDHLNQGYNDAHNAATYEEYRALRQAGGEPKAYERVLDPYIKADAHKELKKMPVDLDLKPYRDSRDLKLLARIKWAQANGHNSR